MRAMVPRKVFAEAICFIQINKKDDATGKEAEENKR
jgi:hypothetical protein